MGGITTMNDSAPDLAAKLDLRLTAVEELLTHFERTLGDLDAVVRQIQSRLDTLDERVELLAESPGELSQPTSEEPPTEEEPPHY